MFDGRLWYIKIKGNHKATEINKYLNIIVYLGNFHLPQLLCHIIFPLSFRRLFGYFRLLSISRTNFRVLLFFRARNLYHKAKRTKTKLKYLKDKKDKKNYNICMFVC